jgi:hypothetical protein
VSIFGLRLRSHWRLPCSGDGRSGEVQTELVRGSDSLFAEAAREAGVPESSAAWYHHARLPDGSDFLRWSGLFEFVVSADGRRVDARALSRGAAEMFQTYALGHVLSFALLKLGLEPFHATALVAEGEAVAFLGNSGYGKSSLAAAFLQASYKLLTDDLLILKDQAGLFLGQPGPPRIKLFAHVAQRFLGRSDGVRMNPESEKLVFALDAEQAALAPSPLRAIYVLRSPAGQSSARKITIRTLRARQAVMALIRNTFNAVVRDPDRLKRQFRAAAQIAERVPVRALSYPRDLSLLPSVVQAVRLDLAKLKSEQRGKRCLMSSSFPD